jgi:DNA-binding CsgD family transcriptional regulator
VIFLLANSKNTQTSLLMVDSPTTPDQTDGFVDQRAGSGIVVLSSSMQLLHMNRQASELAKKINAVEHGGQAAKSAHGVLPTALTELCGEIIKALHIRTEAKDWEQFELKRVAGDPNQPILLRGFGLPDRGGVQSARLVVTMEELGRKQNLNAEHARERFQLTNREQAVVEHLAKGWTNKEIANALLITEQTVKEHIKHIMRKTNASTRTGILVHMFNS